MISIVIPVLNEENTIQALLDYLAGLDGVFEIICVDGGSHDRTVELLQGRVRLLHSPPGRGGQCNCGAAAAKGEILFFLHADCRPQQNTLPLIESAVTNGVRWGCLKLRFDERHPLTWFGAHKSNWRVRKQRIVFGDQGIFLTREMFERIGGFPDLPLMEDYQLSLNFKQMGIRPVQIDAVIIASARRFQESGRLRLAWRMHRLRALYRQGKPLGKIMARYRKGTS